MVTTCIWKPGRMIMEHLEDAGFGADHTSAYADNIKSSPGNATTNPLSPFVRLDNIDLGYPSRAAHVAEGHFWQAFPPPERQCCRWLLQWLHGRRPQHRTFWPVFHSIPLPSTPLWIQLFSFNAQGVCLIHCTWGWHSQTDGASVVIWFIFNFSDFSTNVMFGGDPTLDCPEDRGPLAKVHGFSLKGTLQLAYLSQFPSGICLFLGHLWLTGNESSDVNKPFISSAELGATWRQSTIVHSMCYL